MVTVIPSEPLAPPESVTEAVIVWVPAESELVENEPPEPMTPSRLEVHDRLEVREPSSTSVAVPENDTEVPISKELPLAGAVIVTTGGLLKGPPQPGTENAPTRVRQGALPVVATYSVVYQKVQSSPGSRSIEE